MGQQQNRRLTLACLQGALMVLHVLGLNIQPLLTVGGVGGLAIGFGAQSVTSNAISGLNLVPPSWHASPCASRGLCQTPRLPPLSRRQSGWF